MHPVQKVLIVVGGLAVLVGAVWMGQGAGLLPGSFMTGDRTWLGIGLATAAVGLVLVYVGLQRPRPRWVRRANPRSNSETPIADPSKTEPSDTEARPERGSEERS